MADHVRKQIRDYIAALLADLTTTETRVFTNRVHSMNQKSLPGLIVYTVEEEVEEVAIGGILNRVLDVAVEAYVATSGNIDDDLDRIAAEVETAIGADITIGGLANHVTLSTTDYFMDDEGKKKMGVARLVFQIQYRTTQADPTAVA